MILILRLLAILLLSLEMYIWGNTLDSAVVNTYLAKRVLLSPFFDIPFWVLIIAGLGILFVILHALRKMLSKSASQDYAPLLYAALPGLVAVMFLMFQLPCAFVTGMPLFCAGTFAAWYSSPKKKYRFLPGSAGKKAKRDARLIAFLLIGYIVCGAILCFQYGYSFWFTCDRSFLLLILLPFAGIFLKTSGKLREYISASFWSLLFCSIIYGILIIIDENAKIDLSIAMAYLFVELECMFLLRRALPDVRNISILLFAFCILLTRYLMPQICSPWIVPFSAYILFNLIENRKAIKNFLFFRSVKYKEKKTSFLTVDEFAALSWGIGTTAALWLTGSAHTFEILCCIIVIFAGSLIRSKYLSNKKEDHIILKNFPYFIESVLLTGTILLISRSRALDCILLSVCACAACFMQMIWHIGTLLKSFENKPKQIHLFMATGYLGAGFLLFILFSFQAPTSLLLGLFFILAGLIRIGESSFHLENTSIKSTAGWGLILIGQFISVTSANIALPKPVWSQNAWVCGILACTAYYLFRIFDFRNKTNKESRK